MSLMGNGLVVVGYSAAAVGVGYVLRVGAVVDPVVGMLTGWSLVLTCGLIHLAVAQHAHRRTNISELTRLRAGQRALADTLAEAVTASRAETARVARIVESQAQEREAEIASEMRVLETQILQLAEGINARNLDLLNAAARKNDEGRERAGEQSVSPSQPGDPVNLLDHVRAALEHNRVDLHLQPIVSLPQRKLCFYEALTRLRLPAGDLIFPKDYLPLAERAELVSVIDNLLLFRSVQTVRRFAAREKDLALMCNISAHTLQDAVFFGQFLEFMQENADLSRNLIFEFAQENFEQAGPTQMAHLALLAAQGFRFSLDHVTSLDLDPRYLHERNFRFVKVRAELLLEGTGAVHPGTLRDRLAGCGIDLIAERIEEERTVVEVLELDVPYGQGFLFGEPAALGGNGDPDAPDRFAVA